MDIELKRGDETKVMKYGPTLFPIVLLIPGGIGFIIALVLWFKRGQHKEFFAQLILLLLIRIVGFSTAFIVGANNQELFTSLFLFTWSLYVVVYVYFVGSSVKNANMWRIKTQIVFGFIPENEEVYKVAMQYKAPKWLFFKSF